MSILEEKPNPDSEEFKKIITFQQKVPKRVHFAELHIDTEVIKYFTENVFGRKWVEPCEAKDREAQKAAIANYIYCWYRLGYDYVRFTGDFRFSANLTFGGKKRTAKDTAPSLSRGERKWVEEGKGVVTTWEEFERYRWPSPDEVETWPLEFAAQNLPEGMGIMGCLSSGIFEALINELMGVESLSYLVYDQPDLVEAVANRVGETIYRSYQKIIGLDRLIGFFQGDDLGYKTATMVSPAILRKYILPWHKRLAQLAHQHNLLYLLHSCGNTELIMEDLVSDVRIDGKHSFEDAILPVTEFKKRYGDRVAVLGGVDVHELCRLEENELRRYVRKILDQCMPGGGYALGTGNSVANYIPVVNYLIMLDEGKRWLR